MTKRVEIYNNDDYCGFDVGKYSFYFGWEETYCPKCKKRYSSNSCDKHEDNVLLCFVVRMGRKEIFYKTIEGFENVQHGFMIGIALYLSKNEKRTTR